MTELRLLMDITEILNQNFASEELPEDFTCETEELFKNRVANEILDKVYPLAFEAGRKAGMEQQVNLDLEIHDKLCQEITNLREQAEKARQENK